MLSNRIKKYQYLYLKYKIEAEQEKYDCYNIHHGEDTTKKDLRLVHLWSWLDKINKKYKYA